MAGGTHLIAELSGCDPSTLNDPLQLKQKISELLTCAGMTILSAHFHQFSPQGVTGVFLLAESHFSIHTWPESAEATLDLFTCSKHVNLSTVLQKCCRLVAAQTFDSKIISRSFSSVSTTTRLLEP